MRKNEIWKMTDITLLGTGTLVVTDCGDRHLFVFCEDAV
jgi:hypothetical protein